MSLHAVLTAAGEAPPFVVAGHSAGGSQALQFATMYPELVAGLSLMDSYSQTAIALDMSSFQMKATSNAEIVRPATPPTMRAVPIVDFVRALTPLSLTRLIHMPVKGYKYAAVTAALYGNNKASSWIGVVLDGRGASRGHIRCIFQQHPGCLTLAGGLFGRCGTLSGSISTLKAGFTSSMTN
jgi:pimeloyl-ACP methyl ester carboxylesterase